MSTARRPVYVAEQAIMARTDAMMADNMAAKQRTSKAPGGSSKKPAGRAETAKVQEVEPKTADLVADGKVGDRSRSLLPVSLPTDQIGADSGLAPLAESVRYILARPQIAAGGDLPQRIAVVAALPGEGVTTVSSVFSAILSHDSSAETCRVDLSWSSTSKAGVYEVLMGEVELDDVLEWNGRTATLHSGGVTQFDRHRIAQSAELDKLITALAGRFQHVVLDLPAILTNSDGLAMTRLADAYLLVVKHGTTTLQQVQITIEQLAHVESLGSVLNQVRTRTPRPFIRWFAG